MRFSIRYGAAALVFVAFGVGAAVLVNRVAKGGSTGDFDQVPPMKQTSEARVNELHTAAALVTPAATDPDAALHTPGPPEAVPTGIVDVSSFMRHTFQNGYQQVAAGRLIQIYAGAEQDDPSRGVIVVHNTSRTDLADTSGQTYFTAEKTGSLRIVSGDLISLNLVSTDGTAYTFDATNGVLTRVSVPTPVSTPVPASTESAQ